MGIFAEQKGNKCKNAAKRLNQMQHFCHATVVKMQVDIFGTLHSFLLRKTYEIAEIHGRDERGHEVRWCERW